MTYGNQPQGGYPGNQQPADPRQQYAYGNQGASYGSSPYGATPQGQYAQPQYAQPQYQNAYGQSQFAYAPNGTAAMNAQTAYSYEQIRQAERTSIARAYGEMTIGLIITAVVALIAQTSGMYIRFIESAGFIGMMLLAIVQIGLAVYLSMRIMSIKAGTARAMFYIYAALMGFTLSYIFAYYELGTIGIALGLCAAFFLILTMLALTTKIDMLKFGPVLMVGLIVLIISQIVITFLPGSTGMMRVICAVGLVLFAGMTMYDAQKTKQLFTTYEAQGPEMIKKISIICALNLYLDFVNMFLYLLQLFGDRD